MSDDGGPDEESEEVVNPDDLRSNNINNTLNTKEQKQLFIRSLDKKQQNSKVPLLRGRSSSAIHTKKKYSNNPDILSRRSSERRLIESPTRSTTTSTSLTSKPEEGQQLTHLASLPDLAKVEKEQHYVVGKQTQKTDATTIKMEQKKRKTRRSLPNKYIVSIGVYIENKKGFDVSVYENIENLNQSTIIGLTNSKPPTFIETTNTQTPQYKHFITIGTMNKPTIGAMAFGTSIQILKENAFKIWLKDPTKQKNVREMVDKIETNIDISTDFLPNIKYIGYGDIAEMHVLNSDNSDDEDDFNLNLPLTELQFNNQINHSSS